MGFISSATTTTLNIQLTDAGRSRVLNGGNLINLFSKFGISDSDVDYRNTQAHSDTNATTNDSAQLGFLPDVTGEKNTFRNAINDGYKVKDSVWMKPAKTQVQAMDKKYVALGMRQPNGNMKYYRDTCVIDYYIHDLFVLHKLFAFRYVSDHTGLTVNSATIVTSANTYFNTTLGIDTKGEYSQFLQTLSEYGLGMYGNIWDSIKVYDGNSLKSENVRLVSQKDYDYYNSLVLAGGAFIRGMGNGQQTGIEYNGTTIKGFKQASPFSLFFSPGLNVDTKSYKSGAGEASLGLGAFDWGYLNLGGMAGWNNSSKNVYPKFVMDNTLNGWAGESTNINDLYVGFVTTTDMEMAIPTTTLEKDGYKNIDTTLPTARLVLDVATSNLSPVYYPIPPFMMTEANGDLLSINSRGNKGIKITDTQNPTDAYGRIIGLMEYSSNWNTTQSGFKSSGALFSVFPSQAGGKPTTPSRVASGNDPHYTLLGRMLKMADNMFVGISSQSNSFWSTNKYSGGYKSGLSGTSVDMYNVSIPVTWKIESNESQNTTPLNVTVNFIFNKAAITESIKYKNASSQNYYGIYDNAIFKFYGEDGATRGSYSQDPRGHGYTSSGTTSYETNGGKKLFRKLISGQEIKAN